MEKSTEKNNDGIPIGDLTVKEKEPTIEEIIEECGVGSTILMFYVKKGNIEKVALILAQSPNSINARNRCGQTALSMVTITGSMRHDIAELLLNNGADINNETISRRCTPLMEICIGFIPLIEEHIYLEQLFFQKIAIVELFLDRGADINHLGENHETAIMIAALENGRKELVQFLASRGADINVKNTGGNTAIMEASYLGFTNVVEVLEKWPATMAIILLQELCCYDCCGDMSNLCDLIQFLGNESNYI